MKILMLGTAALIARGMHSPLCVRRSTHQFCTQRALFLYTEPEAQAQISASLPLVPSPCRAADPLVGCGRRIVAQSIQQPLWIRVGQQEITVNSTKKSL